MPKSSQPLPTNLDASEIDLRPARSPQVVLPRLDCALQPIVAKNVIDLRRFAPTVPAPDLTLHVPSTNRTPAIPERLILKKRRAARVPTLPQTQRFPVASIDLSRADVGLPYGVPRYVNAATLKKIAGGRRFDRLLKKANASWEFVPDNTRIDLMDGSQEFRLGRLTIFS